MISKYFKTYINELYIRGFFLIGCITLIIIILLNFIEFINNYFYFFSEIQVNELEYYYYNNNYYNNTVLTYTNYEYDWYIDYNIYFYKFGNYNISLQLYILNIVYFIVPYFVYEFYLFLSPALLKHEKHYYIVWVFYTMVSNIFYFYIIEKNIIYNLFFYWNEDAFIYLDNEVIDIFININELSIVNLIALLFNFFTTQFFFFKKLYYDYKILYILRYIVTSILFIFLIALFLNIHFIITYQLIINWIAYLEIFIFISYTNTYYKILKY